MKVVVAERVVFGRRGIVVAVKAPPAAACVAVGAPQRGNALPRPVDGVRVGGGHADKIRRAAAPHLRGAQAEPPAVARLLGLHEAEPVPGQLARAVFEKRPHLRRVAENRNLVSRDEKRGVGAVSADFYRLLVPDLPVKPAHGECLVRDFSRPNCAGAARAVRGLKAAHDADVLAVPRPRAQMKLVLPLREGGFACFDRLAADFVAHGHGVRKRAAVRAEAQRRPQNAERKHHRHGGQQADALE